MTKVLLTFQVVPPFFDDDLAEVTAVFAAFVFNGFLQHFTAENQVAQIIPRGQPCLAVLAANLRYINAGQPDFLPAHGGFKSYVDILRAGVAVVH